MATAAEAYPMLKVKSGKIENRDESGEALESKVS